MMLYFKAGDNGSNKLYKKAWLFQFTMFRYDLAFFTIRFHDNDLFVSKRGYNVSHICLKHSI